jgi:2-polyprenyl-3-methyl-5-hydroxy-6-metoxy-1,4-benzoquinol methylase
MKFNLRQFSRRFPGTAQQWYVYGKVATDPIYPAVWEVLRTTEAPLLDIGCGMGLLAFYLREMNWQQPIWSVDVDPEKIAIAVTVAGEIDSALHFQTLDARDLLPPHSGNVTLLDILQYLPKETRGTLLQACAQRLSADGVLIIRTGIHTDNWRARCTLALDRLGNKIGWIATPALTHPTFTELEAMLQAAGLVGEFKPLWGRTPFHNWLGVFRHPAV